MGQLGSWGLLGGIGEGMVENANFAEKREENDLAHQRQLALEAVRNQYAVNQQKMSDEAGMERVVKQGEIQSGIQGLQNQGALGVANQQGSNQLAVQNAEDTAAAARNQADINARKDWTAADAAYRQAMADAVKEGRYGGGGGSGAPGVDRYETPVLDDRGNPLGSQVGTFDELSSLSWDQHGQLLVPAGFFDQVIMKLRGSGAKPEEIASRLNSYQLSFYDLYSRTLAAYRAGDTEAAAAFQAKFGWWPPDHLLGRPSAPPPGR